MPFAPAYRYSVGMQHTATPRPLSWTLFFAALVFLTGLGLTLWGFHVLSDFADQELRGAIKARYESQAEQIQEKMQVGLDSLRSIAALQHIHPTLNRSAFARFVQTDAELHTGTLALGWVPRVSADQRDHFIAQNQQENPHFSIYELNGHGMPVPPSGKADVFPVQFLISLQDDALREGLNLFSVPYTRRAMQIALQQKAPSVTRRVRTYSAQGEFGIQAFLPVFDHTHNAQSAPLMLGFATALFDITSLMQSIFQDDQDLRITLLDLNAQATEQLLYHTHALQTAEIRDQASLAAITSPYWTREIRVADRTWLAIFQSSEATPQTPWLPILVMASGLVITSLLTLYLILAQLRGRQLFLSAQALQLAEDKKRQAENEAREKSRFLHAASHDLRQPLASLSLYAELLQRRPLEDTTTKIYVQKLTHSVRSLNTMFNALLQFGQLESGKYTPQFDVFSLKAFTHKLLFEFEPQAMQKQLILINHIEDIMIRSDPVLLDRILRNFLTNAVRYSEQGEIILRLSNEKNAKRRISVRDHGPGLTEKDRAEIFNEFFRGDQASVDQKKDSDKELGLGLGLSIAAESARLLGATIGAENAIDCGAIFYIEFDEAVFRKANSSL